MIVYRGDGVAPAHVIGMIQIVCMPCRVRYVDDPDMMNLVNEGVVNDLIGWGLVQKMLAPSDVLAVTSRGEKWAAMIEATPLPVNRWIDPREEEPLP